MSDLMEYNVRQAPADSTYYTVWNTYTPQKRKIPSYAFLQARNQQLQGMYPMNWDIHGARKLVVDIKNNGNRQRAKTARDRVESAVRRQFGKEMFEHALDDVHNDTACGRKSTPPSRIQSVLPRRKERPKTTGPTRHGSPIYNHRANLLNIIRTQTANRFHLNIPSTDDRPSIRQNIENYNRNYILVTKTSAEELNTRNAKFVSKDVTENADIYIREKVSVVSIEPRSTIVAVVEEKQPIKTPADAEVLDPVSISIPPLTIDVQEVDFPVVEEAATVPDPPSNVVNTNKSLLKVKTSLARPTSGQSTRSNRSARSSRTSKSGRSSISTRSIAPKTWVDDISVSTVNDNSQTESQQLDATANKQELPAAAGTTLVEVPAVLPEPPVKDPNQEALDDELEAELEIEQPKPEPPSFICPSSEEKSREYAIRLWLGRCDFDRAIKTVPMM